MKTASAIPTLAPVAKATRTVALWVPDWPVVAAMRVADLSPHLPAAVMTGHHRVMVASAAARAAGVRRGMRQRTAQAHCPDLILLSVDEARDAAQFEPVAVAAEQVVSGLEVMRPGLALLPADGAARYHGGENELAAALVEAVSQAGFECQVGIADGILAAVLAARDFEIVPEGASPNYLATKSITELQVVAVGPQLTTEVAEVVSLWQRLGLQTLGDLAALPSAAVTGRFGQMGVWAQRLAQGQDLRPPIQQRPDEEIAVCQTFDPPLYQVEQAVVVGQALAANFSQLMRSRFLACGRVRISAQTGNGWLSRAWRTDDGAMGGMSAAAIAQRLRWQLDSWLTSSNLNSRRGTSDNGASDSAARDVVGVDEYVADSGFDNQPAPILVLEIAAEEVMPASTYQASLWGGSSGQDVRAARSLGYVQGLLGMDKVQAVALRGERTPWEREVKYAFGEAAPPLNGLNDPWPSSLPDPAPSIIYRQPKPAKLLAPDGSQVGVAQRLLKLVSTPASFIFEGNSCSVTDWAGPWQVPLNWWENAPTAAVYLQIVTDDGAAYLLELTYLPELTSKGWAVRGVYS